VSRKTKPMIAAELVDDVPPTRHPPVRLNSLENIRVEMTRICRDGKEGRRRTEDASRLTWMLTQVKAVVEAIQDVGLEQKVLEIETRLGLQGGSNVRQLPAPFHPELAKAGASEQVQP
jgi:hypothetical protein